MANTSNILKKLTKTLEDKTALPFFIEKTKEYNLGKLHIEEYNLSYESKNLPFFITEKKAGKLIIEKGQDIRNPWEKNEYKTIKLLLKGIELKQEEKIKTTKKDLNLNYIANAEIKIFVIKTISGFYKDKPWTIRNDYINGFIKKYQTNLENIIPTKVFI